MRASFAPDSWALVQSMYTVPKIGFLPEAMDSMSNFLWYVYDQVQTIFLKGAESFEMHFFQGVDDVLAYNSSHPKARGNKINSPNVLSFNLSRCNTPDISSIARRLPAFRENLSGKEREREPFMNNVEVTLVTWSPDIFALIANQSFTAKWVIPSIFAALLITMVW